MTTTTPAGRLPWEPLERLLRARYDSADIVPGLGAGRSGHGLWSDTAAATMLGVERSQVPQWRRSGMTVRAADKAATHAHLHALEVWGNAWLCAEIGECVRRQARRRTQPFTAAGHVDRAVAQALADTRTRVRFAVRHVLAAARPSTVLSRCDTEPGSSAPRHIRGHQTVPTHRMEAAA